MTESTRGHGVQLLWNKGIASLCDWRIPNEFEDSGRYSSVPAFAGAMSSPKLPDNLISDPTVFENIRDGELVWVRVSWLRSFVKQVLPLTKARFVLVTGDSDSSTPSELPREANAILNSPELLHWYAQNYDGSRPQGRISPVPIGIDFHMLSQGGIWGENSVSPMEQQEILTSIAQSLPPLTNRIRKVYVDFGWQRAFFFRRYRFLHPLPGAKFRESRSEIARKLSHNADVFFQPGPLPRSEMWRRRGEYAFVLSPHGNGLDCHRTWEALALGHIVLVPSSSLDSLYSDLPVVPLKSWSDIRPENLEKWIHLFREIPRPCEKLESSYWIEIMRAKAKNRDRIF